jgi:hypothetical protein
VNADVLSSPLKPQDCPKNTINKLDKTRENAKLKVTNLWMIK